MVVGFLLPSHHHHDDITAARLAACSSPPSQDGPHPDERKKRAAAAAQGAGGEGGKDRRQVFFSFAKAVAMGSLLGSSGLLPNPQQGRQQPPLGLGVAPAWAAEAEEQAGVVVLKGKPMSTGAAARLIEVCGKSGCRGRTDGRCMCLAWQPTGPCLLVRSTRRHRPQEQCQPILQVYKAQPTQRFLYRGEDLHR